MNKVYYYRVQYYDKTKTICLTEEQIRGAQAVIDVLTNDFNIEDLYFEQLTEKERAVNYIDQQIEELRKKRAELLNDI